jgi:hypothetical protein
MASDSLPHFRRRQNASNETETDKESGSSSDAGSKARLKRATKTRRNAIVVSSFFYLVAVVFLVLVRVFALQ